MPHTQTVTHDNSTNGTPQGNQGREQANRWLIVRVHKTNNHFEYARCSRSCGITWVSKKNSPSVLKFRTERDALRFLSRAWNFSPYANNVEFLAFDTVTVHPDDDGNTFRIMARYGVMGA